MPHKAKTLLNAVAAAVTGLATTGANVEKTRGYPKASAPALTVRMGSIDPTQELSNAFIDNNVDIETLYHVSGSALDLDDQILDIDEEVYAAIMADRTMSGAAIDTDPLGLTFDSQAEAETPTATGIRRWRFKLRHSSTDTTT